MRLIINIRETVRVLAAGKRGRVHRYDEGRGGLVPVRIDKTGALILVHPDKVRVLGYA